MLKIFEVEITDRRSTLEPGKISLNFDKKMTVSTKNYDISVIFLQLEGKTKMKTEDFLAGFRFENYTDYLF
jgi:methionyl-tRNA formyltransferase